jgi:hypothetical protein
MHKCLFGNLTFISFLSKIKCYIFTRIYRKLQSLPFWNRRATPIQPNPDTVEKLGKQVHAMVALVRQQTATTETVATTVESASRPALLPRVSQRGRGSRTLYLLICVLVVFVISWLPLNTLNVLLDVGYKQALFGLVYNYIFFLF